MHVPEIKARYVRMTDATVTAQKYTDGSLALTAEDVDEEGMPNYETFSVHLAAHGLVPPPGHVYIKDDAEHEGLPEELARIGVVELVEEATYGPFNSKAWLAKLNESLIEEV